MEKIIITFFLLLIFLKFLTCLNSEESSDNKIDNKLVTIRETFFSSSPSMLKMAPRHLE
jgi:hypothetical protein